MPAAESDLDLNERRLVLSEVHLGKQADIDDTPECQDVHGQEEAPEMDGTVISRYRYLTPAQYHCGSSSGKDYPNDICSSSSGEEMSDGCSDVRCRRRRPSRKRPRVGSPGMRDGADPCSREQTSSRPTHEVLTIVHKMATPLELVGQQVWSAAFLLGDFVLTHGELFAGAQVRNGYLQ